jgi:hypothetical protein
VARTLVLLPLLLALAACGGGDDDEADVKQVVGDFVEATNERDADRLCDDLVTQEYKEKSTLASGERATEACKRQLDLTRGLRLDLISIGKTEVDGERATVRAVIEIDGVRGPRLFQLQKEDGRWRLSSGSSG